MLTDRELTLSFFARQLLHRDQSISTGDAVTHLAALQAQYSPSPYIALYSRVPGFERDQLESILGSTVLKATLMRGTLHLVPAADYGFFAAAWRRQWLTDLRGRHKNAGLDEETLEKSLTAFTATPRTADELRDHVHSVSGGAVRKGDLVHYARALIPLIHVAPSGNWRAHGKPSMVRWKGRMEPEPTATARLVQRYLAAFGPASRADIAHFTYLKLRQIDPALAELDLRQLRDEQGRELVDLPKAPLPSQDVRLPVRFLAKWDAALLSHADRTRMLPATLHKRVYKAINGELLASFLIDGKVAGVWDHASKAKVSTVTIRPMVKLAKADQAEAFAEAELLSRFLDPDATQHKVELGDPPD